MKDYIKPEVEIVDFAAEAIMGDIDYDGEDVILSGGGVGRG